MHLKVERDLFQVKGILLSIRTDILLQNVICYFRLVYANLNSGDVKTVDRGNPVSMKS